MRLKRGYYYILCSLLILAFFVSIFIYYALPILKGSIHIEEKRISEEQLLTGNDNPPDVSDLTELLPGIKININTAPSDELAALPGIGDVLSTEIVKFREDHGPFTESEDITSVPGIGKAKFEAMKEYITVS